MGDVFPPRDLPGRAEDWGRKVEKRIEDGETATNVLRGSLDGLNRNTASSLQVLGGQVRDLGGRETYSAFDAAASNGWNTTSQPANAPFGPSITVTLTEPRVVSIVYIVNTTTIADCRTTNTDTFSRIRSAIFVDGSPAASTQSINMAQARTWTGLPPGPFSAIYTALQERAVVNLLPGTYVFQGGFAERTISLGGSPSNVASGSCSAPSLFVDVLQTWTPVANQPGP